MAGETSRSVGRRDVLGLLAAVGGLSLAGATGGGSVQTDQRTELGLKTIGVLGGLGPQATMDLEARVHKAAQRLIPPRQNGGYPPMVVYYHRHPPFVVNADFSPRVPLQPDPRLLEAARRLGSWADFLIISSNGPHAIQQQIEKAAGRKVLSMIDVTLDEIRRRGWRTVGVIGFGNPFIYTVRLTDLSIASHTLDEERQGRLDKEIMKVMEGRDTAESTEIARDAVGSLRARRVDGVILGCTEIPLLLREHAAEPDLIDPVELLAEAAVKMALA
jgi:aspartate racemase